MKAEKVSNKPKKVISPLAGELLSSDRHFNESFSFRLFLSFQTRSTPQVTMINLQIKLVNINSSDIVDGNETVILGLIWTIILNFQARIGLAIFEFMGT